MSYYSVLLKFQDEDQAKSVLSSYLSDDGEISHKREEYELINEFDLGSGTTDIYVTAFTTVQAEDFWGSEVLAYASDSPEIPAPEPEPDPQ